MFGLLLLFVLEEEDCDCFDCFSLWEWWWWDEEDLFCRDFLLLLLWLLLLFAFEVLFVFDVDINGWFGFILFVDDIDGEKNDWNDCCVWFEGCNECAFCWWLSQIDNKSLILSNNTDESINSCLYDADEWVENDEFIGIWSCWTDDVEIERDFVADGGDVFTLLKFPIFDVEDVDIY